MKSFLRKTKASGSTRRYIELLVQRGWEPGIPPRSLVGRRRRRSFERI